MRRIVLFLLSALLSCAAAAQTATVPCVGCAMLGPGSGHTPATIYVPTAAQQVDTTGDNSFFHISGIGQQTIAANAAIVGNRYRLHVGGYYGVPAPGNTDVLTIKIKWGSTTIISNTITPIPAVYAFYPLTIDATCTVTAIGVAGRINCTGMITYIMAAVGEDATQAAGLFTATPQAIDTTVDSKIDITGVWSATTGSPAAVGVDGSVEIIN